MNSAKKSIMKLIVGISGIKHSVAAERINKKIKENQIK